MFSLRNSQCSVYEIVIVPVFSLRNNDNTRVQTDTRVWKPFPKFNHFTETHSYCQHKNPKHRTCISNTSIAPVRHKIHKDQLRLVKTIQNLAGLQSKQINQKQTNKSLRNSMRCKLNFEWDPISVARSITYISFIINVELYEPK